MIPAYPLQWPAGWKRSHPADFKQATFGKARRSYESGPRKRELSVHDAVTRVREELGRMRVSDADLVISTNLPTRLDGWPRSDAREPDDSAAVYWRSAAGDTKCMAIDRYLRVADNLAAIAATLEAMRAIDRHGGGEILDRAFTGFTALAHESTDRPWHEVLGVSAECFQGVAERAYRVERSAHHPDRGGDPERFRVVQRAWEQACAARGWAV